MQLNKKQLQAIITHTINAQEKIKSRTDGHDDWNSAQYNYFTRLESTASYYLNHGTGLVLIPLLDDNELIEVNKLLDVA